jgi:hypothetical protein
MPSLATDGSLICLYHLPNLRDAKRSPSYRKSPTMRDEERKTAGPLGGRRRIVVLRTGHVEELTHLLLSLDVIIEHFKIVYRSG